MLYVPNVENYQCVVIRDSQTIRAYKTTPTYNSTVDFDDYFYNSHYIKQSGLQQFGNYSTLPSCQATSELTDNYVYRNDFHEILLLFILMIILIFLPIWEIVKRFFRGRRLF